MRPATLAEAVQRISQGEPLTKALSEFFDHFWTLDEAGKLASLSTEPLMLENAVDNCLMAAIAEHLCKCHARSAGPAWTCAPDRFLTEPCFLTPAADPALHEYLTLVSPAAFKRRNLLTSNVILARVRCSVSSATTVGSDH